MNVDGLDVNDVLRLIVDCTIQVNEVHLDRLDALKQMYHEMCSLAAMFGSVYVCRHVSSNGTGEKQRIN